jgi:opacity protein-like surface antigen
MKKEENTMWKKTFLMMAILSCMSGEVRAQSMILGPQLGYYKASGADNGSYFVGVAWRLKVIPILGVEASVNYRSDQYANGAVTVRSWPVMITGLIYPLPIVYGAIGFGWYNLTYDYDQSKLPLLQDETKQQVGWHFGGGLELPIGPNFTLTGDIRYVFLNYDFQQFPGDGDIKSDFVVFTVGCLFSL